ncbi:unnamed protein product, partial [Didymodactylos carnosus]
KFIQALDFNPLDDQDLNDKNKQVYHEYFSQFTHEVNRLKQYLIKLSSDSKWDTHPSTGLSQYPLSIYQFAFEYHTGVKLPTTDLKETFEKIKLWGEKHLTHLMIELECCCGRILNLADDDKSLTLEEKLTRVQSDQSQVWSSKQEMIEAFQKCLAKYRHIFIKEKGFKEFNEPDILVFDNPLLAGGYYYQNKFYLNVCDWESGNAKYEVENLTLHETIPGHHLQIDISLNSSNSNYLCQLFPYVTNGFVEGWGLFAEQLGDSNEDKWIYYGYLQMNILRTFRIIADIMLHVEGSPPEDVIKLAKRYLTMASNAIVSEIYRYRVFPGQAMSYKIGLEVFKLIIKQKFGITDTEDFLKSELVEWYKELLWNTERPLQIFLQENEIILD